MKDGSLESGCKKKNTKLTFGWVRVVLMMRYDGRAVQNEDTSRRWKHDSVCLILSFCFIERNKNNNTHPQKEALKADVCLCFGIVYSPGRDDA